jgi:UDP-N-acetylmuramoyl-L-alanyl-D-glutamate--2,6-diaminopimelate ligase
MKIKDILKNVKFEAEKGTSSLDIGNVTCDSRAVKPGDLFIAFKGFAQDGYKFIGQAVANGAAAVLAERDFDASPAVKKIIVRDTRLALPVIAANFHGDPSKKLKMVGITGTNGKTTITYIIESILRCARKESGVIGTINYRYKGKEIPAKNTTPGPLELQGLLADMLKAKVGYAVMEVSSHSLDQGRVGGILFDDGIFTNITGDHLDYHKTLKNYFKAKAQLFDMLKKGGAAILNYDDRKVRTLAKKLRSKVITYGLSKGSDIRAVGLEISLSGSRFTINTPGGNILVETKLIGRHNVSNILAAVAVAYHEKINFKAIKEGVETVTFAPGRLEPVSAGQPFKVFVDFAHTQDALYNVLGLLKDVARNKRIITVFGCGGNRDRTKRPLMGKTACEFSDRVVITSDNPRFEDPADIIKEIELGVKGLFNNYDIVADRRKAIEKALNGASADDIVVIAGKGHEKYQIVGGEVHPFDDCKVAREIIEGARVRGPGSRKNR